MVQAKLLQLITFHRGKWGWRFFRGWGMEEVGCCLLINAVCRQFSHNKTQKLKLQKNLKTQNITKLTNLNCEGKKSDCDKTKKKPKLSQNSKTQTVIKFKKTNCDET